MTLATRQAASASSTYSASFGPTNAIDGTLNGSPFVSERAAGNWLSVQIEAGTRIGYVAVHNVLEPAYVTFLGSFEVWLGSSFGDTSMRCGEASLIVGRTEPYVLWCGGESNGYNHVTIKQTGAARFLTITQLQVFIARV